MPAASAQESDTVTLNFVNADIDAVVKAVAEITGRNFVLDPRVKGTINIVSARPVPKSLVYPTLLSALRLQGFTAVESDGIVKIVPEADAKMQGGSVGTAGATGDRPLLPAAERVPAAVGAQPNPVDPFLRALGDGLGAFGKAGRADHGQGGH